MADGTAIEWTDATWNPLRARRLRWANGERRPIQQVIAGQTKQVVGWHCEHVSEGCRNCYAEGINRRLGTGLDFKPGHRNDIDLFLDEKMLLAPLKWKKPRMIFVCSMTDLFADFVRDEWIDRMFAVMALCPQHRFQVLTKRAKRMREYASGWFARLAEYDPEIDHPAGRAPFSKLVDWTVLPRVLPNVWLGVSAEDQANADARIPDLLATPAAVRFVSLEPLLGPITLWDDPEGVLRGCGVIRSGGVTVGTADNPPEGYDDSYPGLDWVIVGGESGQHARPMHPDWARSLRDQCQAAGVPYFFKQWGEWHWLGQYAKGTPLGDDGPMAKIMAPSTFPEGVPDNPIRMSRRGGKKRAGRLLDGIEWNGMPA